MKKIQIIGLIATSMFLFAACGSKDSGKAESTTKEKSSKMIETDSEAGDIYATDGSILYQISEDSLGPIGSKSIKSQIDFSQ